MNYTFNVRFTSGGNDPHSDIIHDPDISDARLREVAHRLCQGGKVAYLINEVRKIGCRALHVKEREVHTTVAELSALITLAGGEKYELVLRGPYGKPWTIEGEIGDDHAEASRTPRT